MEDSNVSSIEFDVRYDADHGISWVTPMIEGCALIELVGDFERAQGHKLAGRYSGLVPSSFDFGDLAAYYVGSSVDQWPEPGSLWLVDCECGQAGCWPLEASVVVTDQQVTWSNFRQPHRPEWNYDGFGPFVFERGEYDAAVNRMIAGLDRVDGRR